VRDFQNPSHAESPLYKGFSEENVRDETVFLKKSITFAAGNIE